MLYRSAPSRRVEGGHNGCGHLLGRRTVAVIACGFGTLSAMLLRPAPSRLAAGV